MTVRTTFLPLAPLPPGSPVNFAYWCETERHDGRSIPATALAMLHSPDDVDELVVFGFWPVCEACRFTMEAELELDQLIGGPTVRDDDVPDLGRDAGPE